MHRTRFQERKNAEEKSGIFLLFSVAMSLKAAQRNQFDVVEAVAAACRWDLMGSPIQTPEAPAGDAIASLGYRTAMPSYSPRLIR